MPTVIGAAIGTNIDLTFMRASPMISFFAILGIFYGWIFAIEKNRDSAIGVGLLLGFTLFMGLLLGPLLQRVLGFSNGIQLVMMAAGGTAAVFFAMASHRHHHQARSFRHGQFPRHRRDRDHAGGGGQRVLRQPGAAPGAGSARSCFSAHC